MHFLGIHTLYDEIKEEGCPVASSSRKGAGDQELAELTALLSGPTVDTPHNEPNPEVRQTFMERRMQQREAYGQFVAEVDIYDPEGSIVVFTAGQAVPVEHVERWRLEEAGMVNRVASPEEARKVFRPTTGPSSMLGEVTPTEKQGTKTSTGTSGKES